MCINGDLNTAVTDLRAAVQPEGLYRSAGALGSHPDGARLGCTWWRCCMAMDLLQSGVTIAMKERALAKTNFNRVMMEPHPGRRYSHVTRFDVGSIGTMRRKGVLHHRFLVVCLTSQ